MKLFVVGATGRTGRHIIELALARGHEVTAFVRSPEKLHRRDAVDVVQGDPRSAEALGRALSGHDAVLSALGPRGRDGFRPHTLLTECAASLVAAMRSSSVARLGIVSAALLFAEKGLTFAFFRWLLKHHVRDLETMEAVVTASGLDYTVCRPPRLVETPEATYRAKLDALPGTSRVASFRAVAAYLLDAVERRQDVGQIVGLSR